MAERSEAPTERVRLRRRHDRGAFDVASIYPILDAMPMCSVGYVFDDHPYVTPTVQWREGDRVFLARLISKPDATRH